VDYGADWYRERHVLAKGLGVSDICTEAAKKCLAARGIDASEVESSSWAR
jgi:3-oxoacyl-[acyl-carrier-protein] synthase-3